MGITGQWKARGTVPYASPLKQGTGWNAVHNTDTPDYGRGTATHDTLETLPPGALSDFQPEEYGYCDDDLSGSLYGDSWGTGTRDHPNWGTENDDTRNDIVGGYPPYGPQPGGVPGGQQVRAINKGADVLINAKAQQPDAFIGGPYKEQSQINDPDISDPSQYEMQTSMRQRDQSRSGSQASGTASEYSAPIRSRIVGPRIAVWENRDSYRHDEMTPKEQQTILRPFRMRTAATGNPDWMKTNELYVAEPRQRGAVTDPYAGDTVGPATADSPTYFYQSEDTLPYV